MATVVLGAQWGDEGKGKLTDILCANTSLCARAQGGNNAGHGCVVHIPSFFKELEDLERKGLDTKERIFLSDRAHVVFDLHLLIDGLEEGELTEAAEKEHLNNGQLAAAKNSSGSGAIGTTKKGIGPAYSAKHARSGVRVHQIFNKDEFNKRLRVLTKGAQQRYGQALQGYYVEEEISRFDVSQWACRKRAVTEPKRD
ncbi:MAG: hypothetical protein LQ344_007438 [Seirophora lacunosa]|nr:MAG: hypothetical protein LQ344_007438 [Seirophora lacunosa]